MKKFWKESRTLVVALSLLLCCMVGVAVASQCVSAGLKWTLMEQDADDADEEKTNALDAKEDAMNHYSAVLYCCTHHGGVKDGWESTYDAAIALYLQDLDDGDQRMIDGIAERAEASTDRLSGYYENCDDPCVTCVAGAKYDLAAAHYRVEAGIYSDVFGAFWYYCAASDSLDNAEPCLVGMIDVEEEEDCTCTYE